MDSLTHTVLGACVGEALAGRKIGKKAMFWGAIANNIPDVDVLTSLWMNQPDSLLAHRGFTHSFLFVIIMTPLAGWIMKKIPFKKNLSLEEWSLLFGMNMLLHLIIDSFTVYGTGWFEPFSHYRVAFNFLFVADPFYTVSLFVAAVALLIVKTDSLKRSGWMKAGLILSTMYLVYALYNKIQVNRAVGNSLVREKFAAMDFITTPAPLNNFLWYILAKNESGYNLGYYSVFDQSDEISFHFIPANDSLLKDVKDHDEVKKLIRFSQGYYQAEKINDTLVFNDLRFGQIGGWYHGDAPFVFSYQLTENSGNKMAIQNNRLKASSGKALMEMIQRIKGK